jgi:DNA-binding FrmR family transcriptional regulator
MAVHASHPAVIKRLRRAHGHLARVLDMIESGRPCPEVAQQMVAVESALRRAREVFVTDHLEHCLLDAVRCGRPEEGLAEVRALFGVVKGR